MTNQSVTGHTLYGTLGGILTILLVNISAEDFLKTVVLASVGAIVSLAVSLACKYCIRKWRRK